MGLFDFVNAGKIKKENDISKKSLGDSTVDSAKTILNLEEKKNYLENSILELEARLSFLKNELVFFEDGYVFQEYGLYTPRYQFVNSDQYKEELNRIRNGQKAMIKNDRAITGVKNWTVDGSKTQGNKMVNDMKKLVLRAFNSDCEDVITRVKYSNYDMSERKIMQSAKAIEKLGTIMSLKISDLYVNSKLSELRLAFEYQMKKQEEKESQKQARAEMREAAKLQKEIEAQRKKIEKEQAHYLSAYSKLLKQLEGDPDNSDLLSKKTEIEASMNDVEKALKDIDYREANQRAGYVYVISNIGAFGENVFKIGMTRRLDPQDRVDELGDASVPFNFDVHAMIFSDDAPSLENALHKAFESRKVNMVNQRREFFNVTLDEIKEVVKNNFDKTVEFIDFPEAEQYRISESMRNK